jgi:hypothetical protein
MAIFLDKNMTVPLWVLLAFLMLLGLLLSVYPADARECLSSAAAVRSEHGAKAWAGWSRHVSGHEGQKCYFKSDSHEARVREPKRAMAAIDPPPKIVPVDTPQELHHKILILASDMIKQRRALSEFHERLEWFLAPPQLRIYVAEKPTFAERFASAFPAR